MLGPHPWILVFQARPVMNSRALTHFPLETLYQGILKFRALGACECVEIGSTRCGALLAFSGQRPDVSNFAGQSHTVKNALDSAQLLNATSPYPVIHVDLRNLFIIICA